MFGQFDPHRSPQSLRNPRPESSPQNSRNAYSLPHLGQTPSKPRKTRPRLFSRNSPFGARGRNATGQQPDESGALARGAMAMGGIGGAIGTGAGHDSSASSISTPYFMRERERRAKRGPPPAYNEEPPPAYDWEASIDDIPFIEVEDVDEEAGAGHFDEYSNYNDKAQKWVDESWEFRDEWDSEGDNEGGTSPPGSDYSAPSSRKPNYYFTPLHELRYNQLRNEINDILTKYPVTQEEINRYKQRGSPLKFAEEPSIRYYKPSPPGSCYTGSSSSMSGPTETTGSTGVSTGGFLQPPDPPQSPTRGSGGYIVSLGSTPSSRDPNSGSSPAYPPAATGGMEEKTQPFEYNLSTGQITAPRRRNSLPSSGYIANYGPPSDDGGSSS